MPLHLTPLERLLVRLNLLPVPLFDTPLAAGIAKVLETACELGIFDLLSKGPLSLEELAERTCSHPQGLLLLLRLLVSAGYLRCRRSKYANTAMAQRWLTCSSPVSIAPYILHSPDIVAIWDHLPEVVRTNQQAMRMPYEEDASNPVTREALARHYAGLASLAMALGGEVVQRVRLPDGAAHLLDVGGSHAAYSVLFCRKYPHLLATILDIEPGIQAGQCTAKQVGMEDRLSFVCGNIVCDNFAALLADYPAFDVALYFHVAHLLPPEINAMVLKKVVETLKPGGMLVFLDQVTDQTHGSRLASLMVQFMALTMTTVGGTCYPFATVKGWLEEAGMGQVRRHRLLTLGATLITARKL
jgi:SAM-dependent methyltransferase